MTPTGWLGGAGSVPFGLAVLLVLWSAVTGSRRNWASAALISMSLVVLAVSLGPEVDSRADRLLSVHMVQHLLLALVAAPLLVAGSPVRLALSSLPRGDARRLAHVLGSGPVRFATHPAVTTVLFCTVLVVVHTAVVYDAALLHAPIHLLEHFALFWTAVLLWIPIFGVQPLAHRTGAVARVASLMAAMTTMAVVGAALTSSSTIAYPSYLVGTTPTAALADQHLAGGYMWIGGMIVVLPLLLFSAWRAMVLEERRAQVREKAAIGLEAADGV